MILQVCKTQRCRLVFTDSWCKSFVPHCSLYHLSKVRSQREAGWRTNICRLPSQTQKSNNVRNMTFLLLSSLLAWRQWGVHCACWVRLLQASWIWKRIRRLTRVSSELIFEVRNTFEQGSIRTTACSVSEILQSQCHLTSHAPYLWYSSMAEGGCIHCSLADWQFEQTGKPWHFCFLVLHRSHDFLALLDGRGLSSMVALIGSDVVNECMLWWCSASSPTSVVIALGFWTSVNRCVQGLIAIASPYSQIDEWCRGILLLYPTLFLKCSLVPQASASRLFSIEFLTFNLHFSSLFYFYFL